MTKITSANYINGQIKLDWPVKTMTARAAEKVRAAVNGIAVFVSSNEYIVARRFESKPFQRFQVWGAAGTYAQGVYYLAPPPPGGFRCRPHAKATPPRPNLAGGSALLHVSKGHP
jgi:hypothetical protein